MMIQRKRNLSNVTRSAKGKEKNFPFVNRCYKFTL